MGLPLGTPCGAGLICDGVGECGGCTQASDCGVDSACVVHTCIDSLCGLFYPTSLLPDPVVGDCQALQCDGAGAPESVDDDSDVPLGDGLDCTLEACNQGSPGHPPVAEGTSCNDHGGKLCDGAGSCVPCLAAGDCPASVNPCLAPECNDNSCGFVFQPVGFPLSDVTPGDCQDRSCDGLGSVIPVTDNTDLPADEGNQCTLEVCQGGSPGHPMAPLGTACNQNGGLVCDGNGTCVECLADVDCGTSSICATYTCNSEACGAVYPVTVLTDPAPGDCQGLRCNGSGGTEAFPLDSDVPSDGNYCTLDTCTVGVPSNPILPNGSSCPGSGACVDGVCTPLCGNGTLNPPESCDDGNNTNGDGCDNNCTPTSCGNGVLSAGEVCDDGNNTDDDGCDSNCTPTGCGNGILNWGENCDDGNTTNGDGCDNNCTPTKCGNGIVTTGEACDDGGTVSGNGCSSTCTMEPGYFCSGSPSVCVFTCNNGVLDGSDQCEDGNLASGDGCSNVCKLEPSVETEANNTCPTANGPYSIPTTLGGRLFRGSLSPATDQDWYMFAITSYADVWFETFDSTGPGSCSPTTIDTELQLFKADCVTSVSSVQDQGGLNNCSRLSPTTQPTAMKHLAPGTYVLKVFNYSTTNTYNYTLQAKYVALCGNGVVEGSEQCDGGANCGTDCMKLPYCGDNIRQGSEQCDDGNLNNGDGCSSVCQWETVTEVEPNGTTAAADTVAATIPNLLIEGNRNILGGIGMAAEKDIYKMVITANNTVVLLQTFDSSGYDCRTAAPYNMTAHTLRLLNSAGTAFVTDSTSSGIGVCAAISYRLDAGTYYVQVEHTSVLASYFLSIVFPAPLGNEVEPNETAAAATASPGRTTQIFGDHQIPADSDYFAVPVPAGASIRAEIVEGDTSKTCEGLDMDPTLTLYNAAGTQLGTDGDTGRGWCPLIDGTGSTPLNSYAHALAAGTYYIKVTSFNTTSDHANSFNYRLVVYIN